MDTVVILASGGISSTVAASCVSREARVNLLYGDCGRTASARERSAVREIAAALDADQVLAIDLAHPAQIDEAVRKARRDSGATLAEPSPPPGSPPGIMPTLLLAGVQWAYRIGASRVVCGASQVADEAESEALPGEGRPDRRAEFFHVFNMMLESALPPRRHLAVETPLIDMTREEIVRLGIRFEVPFHLTWDCHKGGETPCGGCQGCRARTAAFTAAGIPDPVLADSPHA